MKKLLLVSLLFLFTGFVFAQKMDHEHKVVFQLASGDTIVHKSLMKQLNNVLTAAPGTKIEIVCHGPGISMLVTGETVVHDKIRQMKKKGVVFQACENTLRDKNIAKEKLLAEAGFVPSALVEIITKQEEGWSYIKAGF
ncbi:MAG TPA: DsrE family protein [Agriterribacter sp.]|nr:DsrE family protein [Agriterribacter sp.]